MLRIIPIPILLLGAACGGQSDEEALRNAAEVSDPAAAQVLNRAAEQDIPPQEALERAGEAQVQRNIQVNSTVQARPNLPQNQNRPEGGQPPETVNAADYQQGGRQPAVAGGDGGSQGGSGGSGQQTGQ